MSENVPTSATIGKPPLDPDVLRQVFKVVLTLAPGECVHVYGDGTVGTGTAYESTKPIEPSEIAWTFHPGRKPDVWACFVQREGVDHA